MKHYMFLDLARNFLNSKQAAHGAVYFNIVCSFVDGNGNIYDASTTLRINGADVLAINSSRVHM